MWIFNFLPSWIIHIVPLIGLLAIVASMFLRMIPFVVMYYQPMRIIGLVALLLGFFLEGGLYNDRAWQERVREMEAKVAKAEAESKEANTKLDGKLNSATQKNFQKQVIIKQYIDREVSKYDSTCIIPKEFISAHNQAAERAK